MRRVLFLDVDGVLNTHAFLLGLNELDWDSGGNDELMIDPVAVARLNKIVNLTGAVVVISSCWRYYHSSEEMLRLLRLRGFEGDVVDSTPWRTEDIPIPPVGPRVRGHEIQAWLDEHPDVESFVILDDNTDMAHLADRLVKTTFEHGLTDELADAAAALLLGLVMP